MKKSDRYDSLAVFDDGVDRLQRKKQPNIDFPFEVGDIENIEMYHYAGVPTSAEKKVVVAETDITDLYDMFENLSLKGKTS